MKGKKVGQRTGRNTGPGSVISPRASKTPLAGKSRSRGGRKRVSEVISLRHALLTEPGDLPVSYGVTRVILLPLEPYLVHVCWELSPGDMKKLRRSMAGHRHASAPVLRFHDVTHNSNNDRNASPFFDIPIDLKAGNWYVHLWSAERSYFVELGLRTADNRFLPIARSNIAEVPRSRPSPQSSEQYMLVTGDYDLVKMVPAAIEEALLKSPYPSPSPETRRAVRPVASRARRSKSMSASLLAPTPDRAAHALHGRPGKSDLAEMSEQSFVFGISSESSAPDRKENDHSGS